MNRAERVGGQAVPNGVMLRSARAWAVAVRLANGEIAVTRRALRPLPAWLRKVPLLRGLAALVSSMSIGLRAIRWSLTQVGASPRSRVGRVLQQLCSLVVAVAIANVLFDAIPRAVTRAADAQGHAGAALSGTIRIAVICLYIAAVGALPPVKRVFAYHGAEHQVVHAHEAGVAVTPSSASNFPRYHPRCGSSFVVLVIAVHALLRVVAGATAALSPIRSLLLPLALPVAFELQTLSARLPQSRAAALIRAPGRALQTLTTRAPSLAQIEVACAALAALEDQDQKQDYQQDRKQSVTDGHGPLSVTRTYPHGPILNP